MAETDVTLGSRIKPSLTDGNPAMFGSSDSFDTITGTISEGSSADKWLKAAISAQFFYSPYDPATRFKYNIVYNDNMIQQKGYVDTSSIDVAQTVANAKEAWLEAAYHHMEFCQVFPIGNTMLEGSTNYDNETQWFTFYTFFDPKEYHIDSYETFLINKSEIEEFELKDLKTATIIDIERFKHFGTQTIDTLITTSIKEPYENNISGENEEPEYKGATQFNLEVYNQAYFVHVRRPRNMPIDSFVNYIQTINDVLGLCLPLTEGFYRYDKRGGMWVNFDEPITKVVE